ncbi:MAG: hypothetical protein ACI9JM_002107 [Halioglobus sp.]|jgi:uncharacterized protein YbjT (DUF2867 family)
MTTRITTLVALLTMLFVSGCTQVDSSDSALNASRAILVTGATGTQGGAVARALLARGYAVRGLTRNPDSDQAKALENLGATMVKGDFDDPASLAAALAGAYGLFAVTSSNHSSIAVEIAHGKQLIAAAQRANIMHFVYTSVSQAETKTGVPHFDSKYEIEKTLYDSGLNYSIVRPVEFMDNLRFRQEEIMSGVLTDPRDLSKRHQWIAAKDIGFFVGEAFDKPEQWMGKAVNIAGDETTLSEFLTTLSEEFNVDISYKKIPWDQFEASSGPEMTMMYRWFDGPGYQVDLHALRAQYPNLITMREYVRSLEWDKP